MKLFDSARTILGIATLLWMTAGVGSARAAEPGHHDIVVYGGTSGGVAAALQAARMGASVILIEPGQRIGGLTTGGLGQTDIGNKQVIGGISREFYQRIRRYYTDPANWEWQDPDDYRSGGQSRTGEGEDAMWTFEPSAALTVFQEMLREDGVPVVLGERLDLANGVRMEDGMIRSIRMESGRTFAGTVFLDATYEGDLMAKAGVSYVVGREPNSRYGETLNGVQTAQARYHQLVDGVDPYRIPGDPNSGLLPGIDPSGPGAEGSGDHRVQAYCFRLCLTDHPENRMAWTKPADYDASEYELLLRNFEAGFDEVPWIHSHMPNRKTDINNRTGVSTDFIGRNHAYPEGDYETRRRIIEEHRGYEQGLFWTLANHPRVPERLRELAGSWGPCRDEFVQGSGWQDQLYIREARRMVGRLVMTQHHCQGRETVADPVGMAAYTMDSHHVQRYVTEEGWVKNEGDVQVGGFPPYPIGYRAITPEPEECNNLLVPVCLSASHIAFGSIRMEPVFMVLGQSAATAAVHAIRAGVPVSEVDYERLRERLLADGQILEHVPGGGEAGLAKDRFEGIVLDDSDEGVRIEGLERRSRAIRPFLGDSYRTAEGSDGRVHSARFAIVVPNDGLFEIEVGYAAHPNRAMNVPVRVEHADGITELKVNQRLEGQVAGFWRRLGRFRFESRQEGAVTISTDGADGWVIVDGVRAVPADPASSK